MSIAKLYAELNEPHRRPTPQSVVEAVMYSLRERGRAALHEPDVIERLSRCDEAARRQINARFAMLYPEAAE